MGAAARTPTPPAPASSSGGQVSDASDRLLATLAITHQATITPATATAPYRRTCGGVQALSRPMSVCQASSQ